MICGIYLAAGNSSRMGCSKLELPLGAAGEPLGSFALKEALESDLDQIMVITKEDDELTWVPPTFLRPPFSEKWEQIHCKQSINGQAESLKCGIKAAREIEAKAAIVLLADQPFVTKKLINHLLSLYRKQKMSYIALSYEKILRPPVLFDSSQFSTLFKLQGDTGARHVIRNISDGLIVELHTEKSFLDVDTPCQYEKIRGLI